jgi:hypothetical protein
LTARATQGCVVVAEAAEVGSMDTSSVWASRPGRNKCLPSPKITSWRVLGSPVLDSGRARIRPGAGAALL